MTFSCEEMAKNVAEKALDDYLYEGKSIREWIRVIAEQDSCEDCISREQAKAEIRKAFPSLPDRVDINSILNDLPTVQPKVEVGHWIDIDDTHSKCDRCWSVFEIVSANGEVKYCPNCGCKTSEV